MQASGTFRIRITDTRPDTFSLSDLADVLAGIDKAIRGVANLDDALDLTMGLVQVSSGSVLLDIASNRPEVTDKAVSDIGEAISQRRPELLPPSTRAGLQQVMPVLRRNAIEDRRPSLQLLTRQTPDSRPAAIITPDMDFSYEPPKVEGPTVIYGKLIWIGGEHPKAHIRLDNQQLLNCVISRDLAQALASRLYEEVGLEGLAEWNTEDWSITSFRITGITPYTGGSIVNAIDALADAVGDGWKNVDDVIEEIHRMRQANSQ